MPRMDEDTWKHFTITPIDWYSPDYRVDSFFHYVSDFMRSNASITRKVYNLEEIIEGYRATIGASSATFKMFTKERYFILKATLEPTGDYYEVSWEVDKVKQWIRERQLQPIQLPVMQLIQSKQRVNRREVRSLKEPFEPIIALDYPPMNRLVVLDGNYRLAKRYLENPCAQIEVFRLRVEDHLPLMTDELCRTLFKVHHNLITLCHYMAEGGDQRLFFGDSDSKQDLGNLYPIQGAPVPKVKDSLWQRLFFLFKKMTK
ncbi:hypothetical protein [Salinithrix halophila]|uniref:Uncharacterized protein n=1 Tax=Salinithrix halophila TaxID=1485204 RepID=A0ABV8JGA7_9BACL